eukprot:3408997-Amphidinium_carterae.1
MKALARALSTSCQDDENDDFNLAKPLTSRYERGHAQWHTSEIKLKRIADFVNCAVCSIPMITDVINLNTSWRNGIAQCNLQQNNNRNSVTNMRIISESNCSRCPNNPKQNNPKHRTTLPPKTYAVS